MNCTEQYAENLFTLLCCITMNFISGQKKTLRGSKIKVVLRLYTVGEMLIRKCNVKFSLNWRKYIILEQCAKFLHRTWYQICNYAFPWISFLSTFLTFLYFVLLFAKRLHAFIHFCCFLRSGKLITNLSLDWIDLFRAIL